MGVVYILVTSGSGPLRKLGIQESRNERLGLILHIDLTADSINTQVYYFVLRVGTAIY
jgi:hypothetical protein